jgi:alpha-N-arabinofuranosidase
MMLRNTRERWWRIANGHLQLEARPIGLGDVGNPSLVARRQQHLNGSATTKVDFDPASDAAEAGIVALQNDEYWYFLGIGREGGKRVVRLRRRAGGRDSATGVVLASAPAASTPIELRITARGAAYDFSWSGDGRHWQTLARGADGTVLSTKRAGGFVGSVFGLYAHE